MKTLTLNIEFKGAKKILSKKFTISDEMFFFLTVPYQRWGTDMERFIGDKEDTFYDAVYTIQDILLSQFILYMLGVDYYTIEGQDINPRNIEFDIYVEK